MSKYCPCIPTCTNGRRRVQEEKQEEKQKEKQTHQRVNK